MAEDDDAVAQTDLASLAIQICAQGRMAFPAVCLSPSSLGQRFAELAEDVSSDALLRHATDVFLAAACVAGDPAALSAVENGPLRQVPDFVARIDRRPEFAAEVAQIVRLKLFVAPDGGQRAKIAEYTGRGPLGGWIRVIAVRVALDLQRARVSGLEADTDLAHVAAANISPEAAVLLHKYRDAFRTAFNGALDDLSARERTLLRLHFADGMTLEQLATSYRVHRSTIARWVARARGLLVKGVERRLADTLKLSKHDLDSMVRLLGSQVDISISRMR